MKTKTNILIATAGLLLCGCGSTGRMLLPGAGAAGGAALGHVLSDGSAIGTIGGAAAGALAVGGAMAWKNHAEKRQFEEGYIKGRADGAKANFWRLEDAQASQESAPRYRRLTITIPARREGAVLYEPQTRTILIAE